MAVLMPKTACNIHDTNAFWVVQAHNLFHAAYDTLSGSDLYIPFTSAASCNAKGVFLIINSVSQVNTRNIHVKLQENVAGTWTTRTENDFNMATAFGDHKGNDYGVYGAKLEWATPYAIDTTAGKWRLGVTINGGAGSCYLCRSDATNYTFAVYSDVEASFTDNDTLIVGEDIEITAACTIGAVTNTGVAYKTGTVYCSGKTLHVLEGAAPYEVRFKGMSLALAEGAFRVGSEASPIPLAKRISIVQESLLDTIANYGGLYNYLGSSSRYQYKFRMSMHGEIPTYEKTTLIQAAASSQRVLVVADNVDWQANDYVQVTHANRLGSAETAIKQIASVSGNTITLTADLASTYDRLDGATVMLFSRRGVVYSTGSESTSANNAPYHSSFYEPAEAVFRGVDFVNSQVLGGSSGSVIYVANSYNVNTYNGLFKREITHCSFRCTQTSYYVFQSAYIPRTGAKFDDNNCHRMCPIQVVPSYYSTIFKSGEFSHQRNVYTSQLSYAVSSTTLTKIVSKDNLFSNHNSATAPFTHIAGLNSIYENNIYYSVTLHAALVNNPVKYRGKNNTYERVGGYVFQMGSYTTVDCSEETPIFTDVTGGTVTYLAGALIDFLIKTPSSSTVSDGTTVGDTTIGSKFRIINSNSVSNNDKVFTTYGDFQRCGDGLADTTVHTSGTGKYSMRFEPMGGALEWEYDVPTGDILNKTMAIGVWCKINSAAYYSGTHTMPTLKVTYDDGTVVSSVAAQTTEWQLLKVAFQPTTSTGKVTVTLSGETDQLTTDAYIYFDDFSALYPAGYQLDLGGLDNWDRGLPVVPPIATNVSAADIWNYPTTNLTASGTTGKKLKDTFTVADSQGLL